MGGLPFLAALRQSYAHRLTERELVDQYAWMARLFRNARTLFGESPSLAARREILRALGEAAFDESALWLLRRRERPVEGAQLVGPG